VRCRLQKLVLQLSEEAKGRIQLEALFGAGRDLGKTDFLKLIKKQCVPPYLSRLLGALISARCSHILCKVKQANALLCYW
jgi:hypothetical protein